MDKFGIFKHVADELAQGPANLNGWPLNKSCLISNDQMDVYVRRCNRMASNIIEYSEQGIVPVFSIARISIDESLRGQKHLTNALPHLIKLAGDCGFFAFEFELVHEPRLREWLHTQEFTPGVSPYELNFHYVYRRST